MDDGDAIEAHRIVGAALWGVHANCDMAIGTRELVWRALNGQTERKSQNAEKTALDMGEMWHEIVDVCFDSANLIKKIQSFIV